MVTDGEWFARYKFLQPIGQGGMGTVFLAEDRASGNATRVIKQMIHKSGDDFERKESVRLFKREADILRTLDHDNIVKIYDSHVSEDGKYFLVMDHVPGRNLEAIISSQGAALSSEEVVRIAIQACEVLEYLHSRSEPIIYRDLKPSNLMLTPDGRIVFIDFGIARMMTKEAATRVVTAGYSPPEQYFGRPETRSDIYSLGATMHHLLTGVRPKPLTACIPIQHNLSVLPALNALVRKMTAHEASDRPSGAQTVKFALYKIYQELHPEFELPDWIEDTIAQENVFSTEPVNSAPVRNLSSSSGEMQRRDDIYANVAEERHNPQVVEARTTKLPQGTNSRLKALYMRATQDLELEEIEEPRALTFVERVKRFFGVR